MRPRPTLADYAVIAISPALIMLMVGSLVFFLIEVFYQGEFGARLCYIMALFVMAAVLIGRISIEEGREYASMFAIGLGVATTLATLRFVQFQGPLASISPLLTLTLVGLIWWSADKLTWDCTVIDEQQDASGEGLLQTAGMEGEGNEGSAAARDAEPTDGTTSRETPPSLSWWQKFVEYRRRPHAPGVWVLYFSLAALPIFGFGQWFAAQDLGSRRYVFQLLAVYLAAGLGLLLTTSFLGLRRYLRQRQLSMPLEMASSWLGVGATMIVAVLLICMLLPRRNPEYSVTQLPFFAGSRDLSPSEMGFGDDGPEDEAQANRQVNRPEGKTESDQAGDDPSSSKNGDAESSGESQEKSQQAGEQKSPDGRRQSKGDDQRRDRNAQRDDEQAARKDRDAGAKSGKQQQESDQSSSDREGRAEEQREDRSESRTSDARPARQPSQSRPFNASRLMSSLGQGLGGLFKLIYWLVTIVIVAYLLWRYWPQVVEAVRNFVKALRDFWDRLWGRPATPEETGDQAQPATVAAYRPFANFPDPFQTGMAQRYTPQQLVHYSFEAFEAWSRERGCPRDPEQTPHEFANAVVHREKSLAKEAPQLAELYCWTAYGQDALPKASLEHLRRFWSKLKG